MAPPAHEMTFVPTADEWSVPVAAPGDAAGDIRAGLLDRRFESAAHVAVCDSGRLVGIVRIEDLLAAAATTPLAEIMDGDPPVVVAGTDEEHAAWKAVRHGESALAVVDRDGRFLGVVTPRRMVEVLLTEHDEDLARLGGYLASTDSARHATEEPLFTRLHHRLPWLLLGLLGSLAAAALVSRYETTLEERVLLASFVPGIVYMADAVGTQTEALVIRGLSVGVRISQIVRRELLTGVLVGTVLCALFIAAGALLWDDRDVIVVVGLSLLAACSTATFVAMLLPWGLHRLGADPAFGSGPLATVVQDLLSLVAYFWIATALLG
jgi:magnesium transporter